MGFVEKVWGQPKSDSHFYAGPETFLGNANASCTNTHCCLPEQDIQAVARFAY